MLKKEIPSYTLRPIAIGRGFRVGFRRGLAFDGLFVWQVFRQAKTKSATGEICWVQVQCESSTNLSQVLKGFSFE